MSDKDDDIDGCLGFGIFLLSCAGITFLFGLALIPFAFVWWLLFG